MKEDNPYIGFISDKSITYVLEDGVNMQFVYNNFYNNAEDIFKTFDFTCVMGAYDCLHEKIVYDDNFWLHNSQKFLSFNNKTSFPIISLLRVGKYKSRGYKISRNEMLKISLAISQLELSSWEEAAEQLGNTYGLSLASFDATDNEPFSIEALLERIQAVSDGENLPMSEVYKYPLHVVDFVVLGKPVEYIEINGETIYTDPDAYNCERELEDMIEKGVLESVELDKEEYLGGDWYVVMSDRHIIGKTIKSYVGYYAYRREQLSTNNLSYDDIVCKVTFDERDIYTFEKGEYPVLTSFTIDEIICRKNHVYDFSQGKLVSYDERATMDESSSSNGSEMKQWDDKTYEAYDLWRVPFIKTHIIYDLDGNTFSGYVLKGGEDITACEILYALDGCGVPFGGSCIINSNGKFSGRYNTD